MNDFFSFLFQKMYDCLHQFYSMKVTNHSKVKTINLDSHIFRQVFTPVRSKLPSHLLKTLAQRKRRQPKIRIVSKKTNNNHSTLDQEGLQYIEVLTPIRMALNDQNSNNNNLLIDNNRAKTKFPNNKRHSSQSEHLPNFKRYHESPLSNNLDETIKLNAQQTQYNYNLFQSKIKEGSPKHNKTRFEEYPKVNLNPYTKDEYIYMKNQQIDQMLRIKRSGKLRRISSITKSYNVGTIELLPPNNYKPVHMKMQPLVNHIHTSSNNQYDSKTQAQPQIEILPSPWEWGQHEEQKYEIL